MSDPLFSDTFTGSGALSSHTPDVGASWSQVAGSMTLSGGYVAPPSLAVSPARASFTPAGRNYLVTSVLKAGSTSNFGSVAIDMASGSTQTFVLGGRGGGLWQIYRVDGGGAAVSKASSASPTLTINTDYTVAMSARRSGTSVVYALRVDGAGVLSWTDASPVSKGRGGLWGYSTDHSWNSFTIVGGHLIVFEGDSLTYGTGATGSGAYPTVVQTSLGLDEWDMYNVAAPGAQTSAMVTDGAAQVDALKVSGADSGCRQVAVIFAGTNDIGGTSDSAATIFGRLQTWVTARLAAGFEVIVCTLPSALYSGGTRTGAAWQSVADTYNGLIRTMTGVRIADLAVDSRLQNTSNTTYYDADGTHFNNTGYAVIANIVYSALLTEVGSVTASQSAMEVEIGGSRPLSITVLDTTDTPIAGRSVTTSSNNADVTIGSGSTDASGVLSLTGTSGIAVASTATPGETATITITVGTTTATVVVTAVTEYSIGSGGAEMTIASTSNVDVTTSWAAVSGTTAKGFRFKPRRGRTVEWAIAASAPSDSAIGEIASWDDPAVEGVCDTGKSLYVKSDLGFKLAVQLGA